LPGRLSNFALSFKSLMRIPVTAAKVVAAVWFDDSQGGAGRVHCGHAAAPPPKDIDRMSPAGLKDLD
jgi:hypothetical protein